MALGINLYSAGLLKDALLFGRGQFRLAREPDLLLVAFVRHRPEMGIDADAGAQDVEDRTDPRIPRKLELALFLGILAICLGLRLYRLGDLTAGMNIDEGGFGVYALRILNGESSIALRDLVDQPGELFLVGHRADDEDLRHRPVRASDVHRSGRDRNAHPVLWFGAHVVWRTDRPDSRVSAGRDGSVGV